MTRVVDEVVEGEARTLLELGSGGGNNASHLKARFECTLSDVSPEMLALSKTLNPECEHLVGDMERCASGGRFDVVFVHDAISYLTTEDDLRQAIETAATHVRPGGVVILTPTRRPRSSDPAPITEATTARTAACSSSVDACPGHRAPPPTPWTTRSSMHAPGEPLEIVHDRHRLGVFPGDVEAPARRGGPRGRRHDRRERRSALEQAAFAAGRAA